MTNACNFTTSLQTHKNGKKRAHSLLILQSCSTAGRRNVAPQVYNRSGIHLKLYQMLPLSLFLLINTPNQININFYREKIIESKWNVLWICLSIVRKCRHIQRQGKTVWEVRQNLPLVTIHCHTDQELHSYHTIFKAAHYTARLSSSALRRRYMLFSWVQQS